jgi:predicted unusual protein kinase regulating ubiquinone biosynthesis (AarF/ABC1/UbiB family)
LLGVETARRYATRVANVTRPEEDRKAAEEHRRLEAADHAVEVLGQMKGAAMKVGQLAALMDFNRLPGDGRDEFQAKLAQLHDSAPKAAFKDMQKVIEQDLGDRISNLFADFDPEAAAAASIGQVFRARLRDGREVAVKVQYPRVTAAVRADLQNLGLLMRAMKHFAPGLDAKSMALEVRERITGSSTTSTRRRLSACLPGAGADTRSSRFPTSSPICVASACSSPNGWAGPASRD